MLAGLVELALRRRGIVIALAVMAMIYGVGVTSRAKLDVFPDFTPPQVTIQTECPGLAPEQVELLVTAPIEQGLTGVGDLESLRSESIQGLSIITATFKDSVDVNVARQTLAEALSEASSELPAGIKPPRMSPLTSATMDLLKVGFTSETLSPMELRTLIDTVVRPRLLAVPGVAHAALYGGEVRQLEVRLRPERLLAYRLTVQDVVDAARASTGIRGAGFIETSAQRIVIQTEGQSFTPAELGAVTVSRKVGANVRLADVAQIVEGAEPRFGGCLIQGKRGVIVTLLSQYGANTLETTLLLEKAVEELRPTIEPRGVVVYPNLFRPATFIQTAVYNITHSLLIGAVLVAVVLFVFMFNLRTALISLTAIPLSLLVAIVVMDHFGMTLNTITLGGLAIAIGEVVDDAIIDVENIWRRLRENAALPSPRPLFGVVLAASLEVRTSVVYATFVVCLVFVPVLTMGGLQGRLFGPLAISYILAVMASLGVALTLTPAMCLLLLRARPATAGDPRLVRWIKAGYTGVLRAVVPHVAWVVGIAVVLCVVTGLMLRGFGGEFLPEFREGHFVIHVNLLPGSSLEESLRMGEQLSAALMATDRVATIPEQVGRAERGEDPWGPHRTEWHLNLKPMNGEEEEQTRTAIRDLLDRMPGITSDITTFLGDRIGETISGETAAVVVNVFGDDLDLIDQKAGQIAQVMRSVHGAVDVQLAAPPGSPQLLVRPRPQSLLRYGVQPLEVLEAVQMASQGISVAQTYEGRLVTNVVVTTADPRRLDPEAFGDITLRASGGTFIRLSDVADVDQTMGRYSLRHDGGRRRQTVTCNVEGRDTSSFVDELHTRLDAVKLPAGMYLEFSGEAEARDEAQSALLRHSAIAGLGILLLMAAVFRNTRNLMLVLVNLPLAFAGGVIAVALTGSSLSIGSLVGFITLFGITMRNSIMMISHYEHLVLQEGMTWGLDAALRGASERLMPIVMTALVTGLGLLPIALAAGEAGREIEGQMAIVILGGLISSTALNLLVLPTLALRIARFRPHSESDAAAAPVPAAPHRS